MKKYGLLLLIAAVLTSLTTYSQKPISSIKAELENLDGIQSVEVLKCDTFFLEKYLIHVEQPVNHNEKNGRTFTQRVFVGFKGRTRPTVFVTEGYAANYAAWPRFIEELCPILDANLVFIEHRYFGESIPKKNNWKYLTIQQSANDHHRVNGLMKQILTGKYVSTGISKGGQTTMYYKYYFPEDVDVWVPFVAPLNFGIADERVNPFINQIDGEECRKKIKDFQILALEKRDELMEEFENLAKEEKFHFRTIGGKEAAYEMMVLEYPFAFWQWGFIPCEAIPDENASDSTILKHLLAVSPMDYFADEGIKEMWPFFYQALTQIGYYDYDTTGMGQYFDHITTLDFTSFAPPRTHPKYAPGLMENVDNFLKNHGNNMIFIYGEFDPWSSTAFVPEEGKTNALKIVKPGGSHTTRINNLPEKQRIQVLDSLERWLDVKIDRE